MIISGRWFHYAQAVIKRVHKIGLNEAYKDEENVQSVVHHLMSLSLLPAAEIIGGFTDIKTTLTDDSPSTAGLR